MVATDKLFAGSIPEIYDRFLVPLIFEPYAVDLAGRVAALAPRDVLETAAGTGVLTRALARSFRAGAHRRHRSQPADARPGRGAAAGTTRIEWKQADALALPFDDASFDVVACQFGVMFFPDKVQGYKEARRVLRPGGRFLFNVWDRIAENEFADVVTQALAERLSRRSAALHGAHAAWPSRRRRDPRGAEGGGLRRRRRRHGRRHAARRRRPAMSPSPTARARRCATRSRRAMRRAWRRRPAGRPMPWRGASAGRHRGPHPRAS